MVLTNYKVTRRIVHHNTLNTTSTNRINQRLINVSVYLSVYLLEIYYIFNRFNYIPNALSCLRIINDDTVRKNIVESILNIFWDEDPGIEVENLFLILSKIYIDDILRQQFRTTYKADRIYSKIIQDLRLTITKENEKMFDASKFGYIFRLKNGLLYSKDNEGIERLVVPFSLI